MPVRPLSGGIALGTPAPGWGELVTSPSPGGRFVFGTFNVAATAGVLARVTLDVETAVGSGVYPTVQEGLAAVGLVQTTSPGFFAFVPPGHRYRFTRSAGVGVTESIPFHSTIDLG